MDYRLTSVEGQTPIAVELRREAAIQMRDPRREPTVGEGWSRYFETAPGSDEAWSILRWLRARD